MAHEVVIELVGDEDPLNVEADVLRLPREHLVLVEGSHARDVQQALELDLALEGATTQPQHSTRRTPLAPCVTSPPRHMTSHRTTRCKLRTGERSCH